jgi:glycosyltransferase involved in cell wall biosynthesis
MLCEDPEARRLLRLAEDLGVSDRVELIGSVDRAEVPELIRSSDVVCCTPWYEPFGLVAVEAMACGVPVVASAVGGLAETVQHGISGVLVPPHRPDELSDAIASVLRHPDFAASLRAGAIRRATSYSWTSVAQRTLDVAASLLPDQRTASAASAPAAHDGLLDRSAS